MDVFHLNKILQLNVEELQFCVSASKEKNRCMDLGFKPISIFLKCDLLRLVFADSDFLQLIACKKRFFRPDFIPTISNNGTFSTNCTHSHRFSLQFSNFQNKVLSEWNEVLGSCRPNVLANKSLCYKSA